MSASRRPPTPALETIAGRFDLDAQVVGIRPLGRGLINDTFAVSTAARGYVLQRINSHVFPRPEQIMANLLVLTELLKQDETDVRIPRIILTQDGAALTRDDSGEVWRMMELIPNTKTLTRLESAGEAREVGHVLGTFHRTAAKLPLERFGRSLPELHETGTYLERLHQVVVTQAGRRSSAVEALVEQITRRAHRVGALEAAKRDGRTKTRITHGDPKLDNILFAQDGSKAVALIDLDTVQPGLVQHDLGDCLRSCCNRRGEAGAAPDATRFDLASCEAILSGYATEMRGLLSHAEIETLFEAIALIPLELGIRFLTDYLEGNRYFRVEFPEQNLIKAQIQLALVADIERKESRLRQMIARVFD
ncbi:aminoglycoside phosphotransferase family protein [Thiorhodococcus mannitoliphagus]|uniref:Aminoglycoside phosphotransferase family protein n=1 Tax=Thiorhodococcus mannitoliphagus TaxID=329406 RepID=A0A6P1DWJ3_9GAMM|nr:aminoglycoside phosphotransferase family protein [Thiorhodococcus mannitoliphagus]NEX20492.1 aminoglycoside phosphotransferase family protein [Thiorhodococcus mannitoliphagus]